MYVHACVIIDLFSRYVLGWMVADNECKHLPPQLFAETIARHGIEPGLLVHSDGDSAMKRDMLAGPRVARRHAQLQPAARFG